MVLLLRYLCHTISFRYGSVSSFTEVGLLHSGNLECLLHFHAPTHRGKSSFLVESKSQFHKARQCGGVTKETTVMETLFSYAFSPQNLRFSKIVRRF